MQNHNGHAKDDAVVFFESIHFFLSIRQLWKRDFLHSEGHFIFNHLKCRARNKIPIHVREAFVEHEGNDRDISKLFSMECCFSTVAPLPKSLTTLTEPHERKRLRLLSGLKCWPHATFQAQIEVFLSGEISNYDQKCLPSVKHRSLRFNMFFFACKYLLMNDPLQLIWCDLIHLDRTCTLSMVLDFFALLLPFPCQFASGICLLNLI